ncbi:kinase domain protein (macronuclear) [Tetrahymena thermophila SB210]|uniref:Kinase domain protein n=1 Tax=Tetrahymena thermophila (strain SB210) TaxID=312017 RepID=I7MCQ0_TETTS|nr:kinase domain protein [Tetrahymena thermophila SB210]EAR84604.1 kinase domain protein [Tetrahymena thermophila SB210]|eukprot:XP_001032267.1 kinase domain protein [Tetrahymena thermophila SB210]
MIADFIIHSGQSADCKVGTLNNKVYFFKEFFSKKDYNHQKTIYQHLNEITNEVDLSILKMIKYDDHKCQIVFPYIIFSLTQICSKVKSNNTRGMRWIFALYHFTQVASSIRKLHSLNLCHCDIKVDHILIEQQSNGLKDILIDFKHCQKIKQNQLSQTVCGTLSYNPLELNDGIAKSQVKPYSPYKLDLYQLGMLLLTLIVYFRISENMKNLISLKKKNKFLEGITLLYKANYNTNLEIKPEVYDLIWGLLTGEIEDAAQIFNHQVYNLQEVQNMLKNLSLTGNTKVFQIEDEEEEFIYHNIVIKKKEDENRSDSTISFDKKFNEMLQSNCTRYDELIQEIKLFCDKNPRQIKESELQKGSLLFEMSTCQILQHLLCCFGNNNPEVFDQNIFGETQDLTFQVTLKYTSPEFTEYSTDDDSDEYLQNTGIEEIQNYIEIQIEIVMIEELKQSETKSIIFTPIKGEFMYYSNLIEDISRYLKTNI